MFVIELIPIVKVVGFLVAWLALYVISVGVRYPSEGTAATKMLAALVTFCITLVAYSNFSTHTFNLCC